MQIESSTRKLACGAMPRCSLFYAKITKKYSSALHTGEENAAADYPTCGLRKNLKQTKTNLKSNKPIYHLMPVSSVGNTGMAPFSGFKKIKNVKFFIISDYIINKIFFQKLIFLNLSKATG